MAIQKSTNQAQQMACFPGIWRGGVKKTLFGRYCCVLECSTARYVRLLCEHCCVSLSCSSQVLLLSVRHLPVESFRDIDVGEILLTAMLGQHVCIYVVFTTSAPKLLLCLTQ